MNGSASTSTDTKTGTTAVTIVYEQLLQTTRDEQVETLSELAVRLRDAGTRQEAGRSDLPDVLVQLLQQLGEEADKGGTRSTVVEQVGRVVANFVADNDDNRMRILDSDYVPVILSYIGGNLSLQAAEVGEGQIRPEEEERIQAARKASVASLLNLIIQGHEPSIEVLGSPDNVLALSNISSGLYNRLSTQGKGRSSSSESQAPDAELFEGYDAVLGWVWTILAAALCDSKTDEGLLPGTLDNLFVPLLSPSNLHPTVLESQAERFVLAAECLASITSRKTAPEPWIAPVAANHAVFEHAYTAHAVDSPLSTLLVLIEHADGGEDEDFAKAKANLTHALVDLGSVLPLVPLHTPDNIAHGVASQDHKSGTDKEALDKAFTTLCTWTEPSKRDDLRMSAFLTIGNAIVSNTISSALLDSAQGQSLARNAVDALKPPSTAQVQHAAMGFLRNLSVPPANKVILGGEEMGIWEALMEADVWGEGKDMLGSVQGGAVGLVKNLCRNTLSNVQTFLALSTVTPCLLALSKRTDDPAIRFEIARIYVNCIHAVFASRPDPSMSAAASASAETPAISTSESTRATSPAALPVLTSEGVIQIIANMLGQSAQYPVLANEAIIALALLATFGGDAAGTAISTALQDKAVIDVLISILCPTTDAPSSKETRANAVTLLRAKGLQDVLRLVQSRLEPVLTRENMSVEAGEISDEGRALCAGAAVGV